MDAATHAGLAVALDHNLPTALQDAMLETERARMRCEDLATHAIMGRATANCGLKPSVQSRHWVQSFHDLTDSVFDLEDHLRETQTLARRALTALRGRELHIAIEQLTRAVGEETGAEPEG
jgi:hypothetical protein